MPATRPEGAVIGRLAAVLTLLSLAAAGCGSNQALTCADACDVAMPCFAKYQAYLPPSLQGQLPANQEQCLAFCSLGLPAACNRDGLVACVHGLKCPGSDQPAAAEYANAFQNCLSNNGCL
jgi:hypothetical protein